MNQQSMSVNAVDPPRSGGPAFTRGERAAIYIAEGMGFGAAVYGISASAIARFTENGLLDPWALLIILIILATIAASLKTDLLIPKGQARQKWNEVRQTQWVVAASIFVIGLLHSIIDISPFGGAGWLRSDALIIALVIFWSGFGIREMIFMRGGNADAD